MKEAIARRTWIAAAAASLFAGIGVVAIAKPRERVVKVVAKKFIWIPAQIKAKKGEALVLHFTAPEVPMGFSLPDFDRRVDIVPGKVSTVKFTPDKAGTFTFVCDVFCGDGHEDMQGTLVVSE
jgi:cytochrome c oxidase subunit 2